MGAGAAGLASAWALRDAAAVTLFEKSRGVSGRAATRRRTADGATWHYDHGAQYAKPEPGGRADRLLARALAPDALARIAAPVVPFTADGQRGAPDPEAERVPKLTGADGVNRLGKALLAASGAALVTQTRIAALRRDGARWTLRAADGAAHGPFDAVLVTAPAPQAADLVAASDGDADLRALCTDALRAAVYRPQFALVLGYDTPVPRPDGAYALVNADRAHPVAWLAWEEAKPGYVPRGSVLVAQMAPAWTRARYAEDREALVRAALPLVSDVAGRALGPPDWADHQRWRYALPDAAADAETLARAADAGLFFAGDGLAGKGRLPLALESGLDAAARLADACGLAAPAAP